MDVRVEGKRGEPRGGRDPGFFVEFTHGSVAERHIVLLEVAPEPYQD
jgi:hypothetical protein